MELAMCKNSIKSLTEANLKLQQLELGESSGSLFKGEFLFFVLIDGFHGAKCDFFYNGEHWLWHKSRSTLYIEIVKVQIMIMT